MSERDYNEVPRRWTVITAAGYWGKGDTPTEAAKNANVNSTYVNGVVYFAHPAIVKGEIDVTGMGGTQWQWHEFTEDIERKFEAVFKCAMREAQGKLRIRKGILECLSTLDE